MPNVQTPFNLKVLDLTPSRTARLGQVTALDYFEGSSQSFNEEGLFSIKIFGNVGSKDRDNKFGYVNIKIDIIHPFILKAVFSLRGLYKDIISSRAYVIWSEEEKDFVVSNPVDGETGYHLFLKHWRKIEFKRTASKLRDEKIAMIQLYRNIAETSKIIIVPAGMRDLTVDETGRIKESELNSLYRSLISISNTITDNGMKDVKVMDTTRVSLQNTFNKIYDFFDGIISGKGGFINSKYVSRNVYYGTRNVITAMTAPINELGAANSPKINNTVVGFHQVLYAALPFVRHYVIKNWSSKVFSSANAQAKLIDPVTLRSELVKVAPESVDKWMTTAGIDSIVKVYADHHRRMKPVMIEGRYFALVYRTEKTFRILWDISELPNDPEFSAKDVHPITYCELLYLAGYQMWNKLPIYVTRYPVAGMGSIYPSFVYTKTTTTGSMKSELGEDWKPIDDLHVALEYPDFKNSAFMDSMSVHPSRLKGLTGDHDGDMCSGNILLTDEAIKETHDILKQAKAYLNSDGKLSASAAVDTVQRVIYNMSGE